MLLCQWWGILECHLNIYSELCRLAVMLASLPACGHRLMVRRDARLCKFSSLYLLYLTSPSLTELDPSELNVSMILRCRKSRKEPYRSCVHTEEFYFSLGAQRSFPINHASPFLALNHLYPYFRGGLSQTGKVAE